MSVKNSMARYDVHFRDMEISTGIFRRSHKPRRTLSEVYFVKMSED